MDAVRTADSDVNAIKALGEEYFRAANAGDTDRCIATMARDVIIMPPDRLSISGIDQLRRLSSDYHAAYEVEYKLVYDEVEIAGEIAFVRATATGTRKSRMDGTVERVAWRNLWILRRQPDGTWKFWRIMFNTPTPK
ncbi:MAG TPA: DUF4440 domain-containing protein [Terriglobales bacterium]|jgi:ketosteroid isomerase-like protein|nr:DUF4440 domain-containing protein [Terriglobales bacterium]